MSPKKKKQLKILLKILFSIGALYLVISKVPLEQIVTLIASANLWYLGLAFVIFNLSKILSSIRLNRYFHILGAAIDEISALKLYYIGMFYNLFLPGGIGGDGYKIYLLKKAGKSGTKSLIAATLLDRLSGLVPLIILAILFFLGSSYLQVLPDIQIVLVSILLFAIPLFYLMQKRFFPRYLPVFSNTLLYGFGVQLLQVAAAWALFASLGTTGNLPDLLFLFLLSSIMAVLPLSVGGIGLRELVFLYGFSYLQIPVAQGVAFAMLFFLITALSSLIGLFVTNPLKS